MVIINEDPSAIYRLPCERRYIYFCLRLLSVIDTYIYQVSKCLNLVCRSCYIKYVLHSLTSLWFYRPRYSLDKTADCWKWLFSETYCCQTIMVCLHSITQITQTYTQSLICGHSWHMHCFIASRTGRRSTARSKILTMLLHLISMSGRESWRKNWLILLSLFLNKHALGCLLESDRHAWDSSELRGVLLGSTFTYFVLSAA